jgi:spore coat protein U-like protein
LLVRAAAALVVNQTADLSSLIGLCRRTHRGSLSLSLSHTNAPANSAPRHTKKAAAHHANKNNYWLYFTAAETIPWAP